jgi:hypothetical protein
MKYGKYTAFILLLLTATSLTAFGDIKIRSRQTMSGQTMENVVYIKGKRQRTEMMDGQMITLVQCDLRRSVQMNSMTKTYIVSEFAEPEPQTTNVNPRGQSIPVTKGGTVTMTVTIKDTGERKKMFGYTARHLIITTEMKPSANACNKTPMKMETDGWYIDFELEFNCYDAAYNYNNDQYRKLGGCQDKMSFKQIGTAKRGYPVYEKMTMFDESGKQTFTTVTEVIELSKATLEPSLFDVASDYREVQNFSEMYASSAAVSNMSGISGSSNSNSTNMSMPSVNTQSNAGSETVGPKQPGTVRIGIADVKVPSVGEGITGAELASAVEGLLAQYLKMPNIEVVFLDAKLPAAIKAEAVEKQCDLLVLATVTHKKGGGGGFGAFSKVIAPAIGQTGIGHTGSTAGNIAGAVATRTIVGAGEVAAKVKAKDELTLEVRLDRPAGASAFVKTFKRKAKNSGEDILSPVVEEAAQAIVDAL